MVAASPRLQTYNGALRAQGSRLLATLTDDVESRYVLDDAWDNNAVQYCLETGYWAFAMRASKLDTDPDIAPKFGFPYGFTKPSDYIKLSQIAANEYFTFPLQFYADEQDKWYTALSTIYVQYLSNDSSYGFNYAAWPQSFANLVQVYLALQTNLRITKSMEIQKKLEDQFQKTLRDARSKNAMNQPAKFMPAGTWNRARLRMGTAGTVPMGIFTSNGQRDY